MNFITPEWILNVILMTGIITLVPPIINSMNHCIRNCLLIILSIVFLVNVLFLDYCFLQGMEAKIILVRLLKYTITFHLESLSMIFLTLLAVLWVCALLYTIQFLHINHILNSSRFLFFLNCCMIVGSIIALSGDLFTMFISYEILTLCTIPLITHNHDTQLVSIAISKYISVLMLSSIIFFLPAIVILYSVIGHGNFTPGGIINGYFVDHYAIVLLLSFVFGISKVAIYPFHSWLPSAMIASYPVSALLHAVVVVKTGLFCIYKILYYIFGLNYLQSLFVNYNWLIIIPIITIIYSAIQSIRHKEIKIILAYSTMNQLSIALLSAFLLTPQGIIAAITHMVTHALTKISMFYAFGNVYSIKNTYYIKELTSLYKTMPITSFILLISGLSLMGVPPLAGFTSKFCIMLAAAESNNLPVMITLVISTLFSAVYIINILVLIYTPSKNNLTLNLQLMHKYSTSTNTKGSKKPIEHYLSTELKLPVLMIISPCLCLLAVIFFLPILQQGLAKFFLYI